MSRQLSTTRPFPRRWSGTHQHVLVTPGGAQRPACGGALVMPGPRAAQANGMVPWVKPVAAAPGVVFAGMDPSDPSTYVRRWNPAPGMVDRLNWDGAAVQGETEMGGTWGLPAWRERLVGGRPANRRRP